MTADRVSTERAAAVADFRRLLAADLRKSLPTKGAFQDALRRAVDVIEKQADLLATQPADTGLAVRLAAVEAAVRRFEANRSDDIAAATVRLHGDLLAALTGAGEGAGS